VVVQRPDRPRRPFSLRLRDDGLKALQEEAARYRTAPRTLAQEILEEGLRMRRFPGIAFADRGGRRRAVLSRRPRLQVGQVMDVVLAGDPLSEVAEALDLTVREVEEAIDYYRAFRSEIDREREDDRTEAEQAEREWRERQSVVRR
jgi:hypothetical protein